MAVSSRQRRGSILIAVVGVLVLLALLATSFLSATRRDRVATQQSSVNDQTDLLLQGLVNAARGEIAEARDVPGESTDAADLPKSDTPWLASRVPGTIDPNQVFSGNAANDAGDNRACWPIVSGPLLGVSHFESPMTRAGASMTFMRRDHLVPTFLSLASERWPALGVPGDGPAGDTTFIAGDADGDGIADAGLFRLPVGRLSGVTYFGAVRIVDDDAAVNLNTALSRDYDVRGDGTVIPMADNPTAGAFSAHVGLAELLRTAIPSTARNTLPPAPTPATVDHLTTDDTFARLNTYRWGLSGAGLPIGIAGAGRTMVIDDTPLADGRVGARADITGTLPEYQFATLGDCLQNQVAARIERPGISAAPDVHARSLFPEGLALSARFCLAWPEDAVGGGSNPLLRAIDGSIHFGPTSQTAGPTSANRTPVDCQPFTGSASDGIDRWFTSQFDVLSEDPSQPSTWMNRRTLLVDSNGTSEVVRQHRWLPSELTSAPARVPRPLDAKASINTAPFADVFASFFQVFASDSFDAKADDQGTPFSALFLAAKSARAGAGFDAAAGIYTAAGASADGFYADPYIGTRFDRPEPSAPLACVDRLEPPGLASVVNGQSSSGGAPVSEQHPLRMFRSPLRVPAVCDASRTPPAGPIWTAGAPRLPADQVLILRAALAAANLEAMRDSSHDALFRNTLDNTNAGSENDRTTCHRIPLTALIDGTPVPIVANVYGLRRQPYITEIYANTSAGIDGAAPPAPPASIRPNPKGYVAIKLFNPTDVAISLRYCRLVGLHRSRQTPWAITPGSYQGMSVQPLAPLTAGNAKATDQVELGNAGVTSNVLGALFPPYVIPPHGTLVLENLPGSGVPTPATAGEDATYRPTSTGLLSSSNDNTGLITPTDFATQNFAYVPGLSRVVWDRDLIVMRPANCRPPTASVSPVNTLEYFPADPAAATPTLHGMVPLDSYDFTGLAPMDDPDFTPVRTRAEIWHYVRSVNASGATAGGWRWVYPGRYDADQSIPRTPGDLPAPRQQGTVRAVGSDGAFGWDPHTMPDKDPLAERPIPGVAVCLGLPIARGTAATYPDGFTLRLNAPEWGPDHPLHDFTMADTSGAPQPNQFPFGGFCRLADLLRVPFVGSYTLQTAADVAAGRDTYLEITPVTMDAVFAEDTDPADNERPSDDGRQSREQIGRFIPLRPSRGDGTPAAPTFAPNADPALPPVVSPASDPAFDVKDPTHLDAFRYGDDQPDDPGRPLAASDGIDARLNRYAFANRLFDYFCVTSPHDDAVPNYPSQPNWQPSTAYVSGDVVQYGQHLFVCKQPHVSSAGPAATRGAPDWLIAGATAAPPEVPYPTPPVETRNWLPLARYPLANGAGPPGSRSDLVPAADGNPAPADAFTADDANEIGLPVPGRINLNTAPEKVLAALPWSMQVSSAPQGDRLTFHFDVYPPSVDFTPDGIDDNAQIAHAIVLYRDGRYAGEAGAAGGAGFNALDIAPSSQTWAAAERPFRSLFDLYRVPGVLEAQRATLTAPPQDPGYQTHGQPTRWPVRFDFEAQTLLMNRVSSLLTTRSDAFTLYALVQGWRDAGTDHARLVAQRRTALRLERRFDADGRCRVVPMSIIATR